MPTTSRPDPRLLIEAERDAAENGTSLTSVLEEALRASSARCTPHIETEPVRLQTVGGTGLRTGVDLDDRASMAELMAG